MTITVENVNTQYPSDTAVGDKARTLVSERFTSAKSYGDTAKAAATSALASLGSVFASSSMPDTDISYAFQDIILESNIRDDRPEPPSSESLTPAAVAEVQVPDFPGISVPNITVPAFDVSDPISETFTYTEIAYQSDLFNVLKVALKDLVENGGTGLGATVESELWARARARQETLNERTYEEANEYFSSRGYTLPPGALAGRLTEAVTEQNRADSQLNYEISIEQGRLAYKASQMALEVSTQLEGISQELANNIASRAYQYAKDAVTVVVDVYNAKVAAYAERLRAKEAEVGIEEIRANVQIASNKHLVDKYAAEVEAYKVQVASELAIVENIAKVYSYKVMGYEADAKVAASDLDAQIKVYQGHINQAYNQTRLSLAEAELTLRSYLGALELNLEGRKATANVAAQLAASALSAVNASAAIGYSVSRGRSDSVSHSTGVTNTAGISESHNYDESA